MLEERISELEKLERDNIEEEEKKILEIIAKLMGLIKRIPIRKILRFKGNDRTILIIKWSNSTIRILDTDQKRFSGENLKRYANHINAAIAFAETNMEETIRFISDPEVKMEIFPIESGDNQSRSAYAKYIKYP